MEWVLINMSGHSGVILSRVEVPSCWRHSGHREAASPSAPSLLSTRMCVPRKLPSALSCLADHTSAPQRLRIIFELHGQEVVRPFLSVQLCFFWLGRQNLLPHTQLAPNRIPFASRRPAKSYISSKWSFTYLGQQNQVCSKPCGLYFFSWIDLRLHCTPNKEINLIIWCHTLSWAKKKKKKGVVITCSVCSLFWVTHLGIK